MAWPTGNVSLTNVDADSDSITSARSDIYTAFIKLNEIITNGPGTGNVTVYNDDNVAAFLPTYTGNLQANVITTLGGIFWSNGTPYSTGGGGSYGNVETGQYLTSGATSITANLGNIITNNGIFWANGSAYSSGGGGSYGNVQVEAYLKTFDGEFGNIAGSANVRANVGFVRNTLTVGRPGFSGAITVSEGSLSGQNSTATFGTCRVLSIGSIGSNDISISSSGALSLGVSSATTLILGGSSGLQSTSLNGQSMSIGMQARTANANLTIASTVGTTGTGARANLLITGNTLHIQANVKSNLDIITSAGISSSTLQVTGNTQIGPYIETVYAIGNTGTGTITPAFSNGPVQTMTATGNFTLAEPTGMSAGASIALIIRQDATGVRICTFNGAYKFANGSKTLSTTANSIDVVTVFYDGTNYLCALNKGFV